MKKYRPELIFIDNEIKNHPETARMLQKLEGIKKVFVDNDEECLEFFKGSDEENFGKGKAAVFFTKHSHSIVYGFIDLN